mgnify:FL=1
MYEFGKYISKTRMSNHLSLEQLSEGICDSSNLNRIEHGKRYADKLTRDRMLGRIGIDGYDYENYINIKEYGQWKIRMEILNNISNGNLKEAYQKIKTYSESYDKYCNGNLKMQFCIFAYAQIKKRKGYNRRLGKIFADALECTVKCSCDMISSKVLSVQELLFIMDDACYNRKPERMQIYEQVVEYIEKPYFDVFSKAMIYPKAVVNICREIFMEQNEPDRQSYVRMLELCSGAKDILGEAKKTYYLWELSRLLKNIYSYFLKNDGENSENGVTREQAEGNQGFMRAFKEAGRLAGISVKMQDDTYIYKEYGVYCTADVIYKRRRTLGLTVRQLADGYMIERTLAKIESGRANPHATTIKELFKRLNMSAEYSRLEIVTDKVEAKDTIRKLKANCNGLEYDKALVLLTNLKGMIDLDIPVNRQYIIRTESCIEYDLGLIDKQQHIEDIIQALECTIPYEKIVYGDELFMTQEESMCINSIFSCGSSDFDSKKIEFIEYVYKNYSDINHEWMYDVFMSNIASWCGNEGDYDTSDRLSRELIKNCLIKGRLNLVDANFYNMAWNMKMRGDCAEKDNDYREYVLFAYYISSFCKKDNYKQLYSRKLKE